MTAETGEQATTAPQNAVFLAMGEEQEMFFNGPMRSGLVLDSQALLNAGYRKFQTELAQRLRERYMGVWECPAFHARKNNMAFDVDSFQGENIIPRYLISRAFFGDELLEILEEFHLPQEIAPPQPEGANPALRKPPAVFRVERLDIHIFDYGYASCTFTGAVAARRDLDAEEYCAAVETISSSMPDYTELFQSTIAKVAKVIPEKAILLSFHGNQPLRQTLWPQSALGRHIGELFWVHRIFSIPCADAATLARMKDIGRHFLYTARAADVQDVSLDENAAIYAGNGNSCIVYLRASQDSSATADGDEDPPQALVPRQMKSVLRAKNVFYAAVQDLDRDLFYLNNEMGLKRDAREMSFIERQAQFMSTCLVRVNFLTSVFDDYDRQLDPQSLAIWRALQKAWLMDDMFRTMEQKVATLDKTYDRAMQRLSSLQNKTISAMIGVFIALALAAVVLDLFNALPFAKAGPGPLGQTILLAFAVVAATLLAVRYYRTNK